jgi:hypothetical protein
MAGWGFRSGCLALTIIGAGSLAAAVASRAEAPGAAPSFSADGTLNLPKDYRTWVFLTAGHDMS